MTAQTTESSVNDSTAAEAAALRRFLATLAKFLLVALPIYAVFVCLLGLLPGLFKGEQESGMTLFLKQLPRNLKHEVGLYGHMFTRAREAKNTRDVDILFVGSSYAYRGFDPRIFARAGLRVFNLGSSMQTHLQTRVLLKRYLKQMNPKIVVYEVSPSIFGNDGVESAIDIISSDRNDLESVRMALQVKSVVVFHTLIYGFFRDLFGLNENILEDTHKSMDTYVPGGYVERELAFFKGRKRARKSGRTIGRPIQIRAFEENLAYIRANGIRVVLVRSPWTRYRYERQKARESYDEMMKARGEYYDFNQLLDLQDTRHFYDAMHLNQLGVELFNRELIRLLFPERRPDPASKTES